MPTPTIFPNAEHAELNNFSLTHDLKHRSDPNIPTDTYRQFSLAHNAILWRFRAAVDAGVAYRAAYAMHDGDSDKRYVQERELFNFFAAFVSCVEVICYCAFSVGSMADAASFPLATDKDRKKVNPVPTKVAFGASYPTESIAAALDAMLSTYSDADTMRNLLSHRGSPPRQHFAFIGGSAANRTEWGTFEIDAGTTARLLPWLQQHVKAVLDALCEFARAHL